MSVFAYVSMAFYPESRAECDFFTDRISSHVGRLFTEPLELSVQNSQSMQGVIIYGM